MREYFAAVVGGVLIALNLALGPFLHRWRTRWNATTDELKEPLPGDEIVQKPTWTYTHAIRILPRVPLSGRGSSRSARAAVVSTAMRSSRISLAATSTMCGNSATGSSSFGPETRSECTPTDSGRACRFLTQDVPSFLAARLTATAHRPHGASICIRLTMV
jgi:hypothetical protein